SGCTINGMTVASGTKKWCDGNNFCSWGQQECEVDLVGSLFAGHTVYHWGVCVEGNPRNPPNPAPNTTCSCYYPFSYNPQCCENPATCIVQGERQTPCGANLPGTDGQPGGLCAPCGNDSDCGGTDSGKVCVRQRHSVADTPNGGGNLNTVEQFCSRACQSD